MAIDLKAPPAASRDLADLVRADRAHTSLYTDPAIFEQEMDRIFASCWVWVAHVSEVKEAGDYKSTYVGRQPVVVVRDRKQKIHVLLNRCRHRAATVCEEKKGRTNSFVCPYHGWSYGLDGSLRGVPHPESYGQCLDKGEYPLKSLRVEEYAGMVFATFREDIEPLADWLGPAKKWMDLFMKQGGGYPIKVAGEHRFRFPGNWKIQLENTTDGYHFPVVHKSFLSSVDEQTERMLDFVNGPGFVEDLGNGHSVMVMIPELVDLEENLDAPVPARFAELAEELRKEGHDEAKVRRIVRAVGGSGFNLNLFPNIACSMAFFRVLRPVSVNETEIHHAVITMDGGPAAANRARLRLHEHFQGPMGFGTPDDSEAWERVQKGAQAGTDLWILLNRGLPGERVTEDGRAGDVSAETGMRAAYQQWKKLMTGRG
ncbi:phenylpropionate dioxygenase-like ring-hydroxylating dioxygenase large terminal subunit [Azospirillum lipoferum]|uniref:Rieske 2Fe-2S domain-containing protein n=1 Tax=Azospirillum lipoferum TaxID=193 RepID=A0A5A9GMD4_AZOLI|nr:MULTISPECIES: Rieske 2Fe-2S domain-containing protein [Azospirillum]KAA0594962.1 Rieske 2Fe-2S domain-containing protein [Azospirillum lipoferum]MCP1612702.1 phenylpropionate dioxygenase-like ring-hydroxylating dioxygenase large terminal subunit [Azospirillum lipoferum]MDW5532159.1 Rieske 2Fe-2S domain-containing protein [Azospirillum sp. NL1]